MRKILLVEANEEYRNLLRTKLSKKGYLIDETDTPIRGLEYVAKSSYDVVISDLDLPIMSGIDFTEAVKNIANETICILLTEDPDECSELASIKSNVDLYFEKSKSISILVSYIERLLCQRDEYVIKDSILESKSNQIVLSVNEHTVKKNGKDLELTPKEYEILKVFLEEKNKVITREKFVELAWEEPTEDVDFRLVDTHVKKLRDKLKTKSIMTVRGYGYRWNEE